MAEPLSICASVIAILQLGDKVTSYFRDVRNADKEQKEVQLELYSLNILLTSLRYRVEEARADEPWFQRVKLLGTKDGELDQFIKALRKIEEKIDRPAKRDIYRQALLWKFTIAELKNILERIERLKSLIQLALADDQL